MMIKLRVRICARQSGESKSGTPRLYFISRSRKALYTFSCVSMLKLVVERSFSVRCMYQPADYTPTPWSAWAQQPALVRVELVLCLLLDALYDWLQAGARVAGRGG